jgi:hypothetical protein
MIDIGFILYRVAWLPAWHVDHTAWFVNDVTMVKTEPDERRGGLVRVY